MMKQGLYEATEVVAPEPVAGRMRRCGEDDRPTAVAWMAAFYAEALPGASEADADAFVTRRLSQPDEGLVLWEREQPVSLAGFTGPTPSGIRIGPVYTPPELRGRGYASALTAALTQELLADGRRVLLPVHRPRQPDVQLDLPAHRLSPARRCQPVVVRTGLSQRRTAAPTASAAAEASAAPAPDS